jgi:hypothetical protein
VSAFSALPHSIKPTNYIEIWSAGITWFFLVTNGIFLLGLIWFMLVGSDPELRLNKYKERVGAIYTKIDYSSFMNRLVPIYFVLKRELFAVSCWYIKIELVAIFIEVTLLNLCLIIHTRPYLDTRLFKTELFNEVTALVFFTLIQAFKP